MVITWGEVGNQRLAGYDSATGSPPFVDLSHHLAEYLLRLSRQGKHANEFSLLLPSFEQFPKPFCLLVGQSGHHLFRR